MYATERGEACTYQTHTIEELAAAGCTETGGDSSDVHPQPPATGVAEIPLTFVNSEFRRRGMVCVSSL